MVVGEWILKDYVDLLRLMTEEYTFIPRPVIVRGDRATARPRGSRRSGWTT
jgi:hypothetical protein